MVRHSRRNKRGGDINISSILSNLDSVKSDIDKIKDDISSYNKYVEVKEDKSDYAESAYEPEASGVDFEEEKSEKIEEKYEPEEKSTYEEKEEEEEEEESEKKVSMDSKLNLPGFTKTVKDLVDNIKTKISQLDKPSNKNRYSDKVDDLKTILSSIKGAKDAKAVEDIVMYKLSFKNNNLIGGKSRKRRSIRGRKTIRH